MVKGHATQKVAEGRVQQRNKRRMGTAKPKGSPPHGRRGKKLPHSPPKMGDSKERKLLGQYPDEKLTLRKN